jgi:hypothetical protein
MANELVTKSGRFYCISLEPDICKTPVGPATHAVPYTIKGEFADATGISPNIRSGRAPVVIHSSTVIPTVTGDEDGTAKGVKSGTVAKRVQHDEKSATVSFNGERAIREGDRVFMNDRNTTGKIYERGGAGAGAAASMIGGTAGDEKVGKSATAAAAAPVSEPLINLLMAVHNPEGAAISMAGEVLHFPGAALAPVSDALSGGSPMQILRNYLVSSLGGKASENPQKAALQAVSGLIGTKVLSLVPGR